MIRGVALMGGAFTGKSTISDGLRATYGYGYVGYSDLLKTASIAGIKAAMAVAGVAVSQADIVRLMRDKEVVRPFYQAMGDVTGFSLGGIWVDLALERVMNQDYDVWVVDCIRTPEQAQSFTERGFVVARVTVADEFRAYRAMQAGHTWDSYEKIVRGHPIENHSFDAPITIDTTFTPPEEAVAYVHEQLQALRIGTGKRQRSQQREAVPELLARSAGRGASGKAQPTGRGSQVRGRKSNRG